MAGLLVAARYLTVVPLPGAVPDEAAALGRAAGWFPVVGLALGAVLAGIDRLVGALFSPLLAALLTVTVWKTLTGGLHLDGLADCLDGLAGRDTEHRLAIMRDSRIGAFGAMGLILFLLLEVVMVAELPAAERWRALLVAPAIARATAPLLARVFPAARPGGRGEVFRASLPAGAPAAAGGIALGLAGGTLGVVGLVAVVAAGLQAMAIGRFMARRLGGVTGDVLGAAIEATEMLVLLTVLAWVALRS